MNRTAALHPSGKVQLLKCGPLSPTAFRVAGKWMVGEDRLEAQGQAKQYISRVWEPKTGEGFAPGWESRLVVGITVRSPF